MEFNKNVGPFIIVRQCCNVHCKRYRYVSNTIYFNFNKCIVDVKLYEESFGYAKMIGEEYKNLIQFNNYQNGLPSDTSLYYWNSDHVEYDVCDFPGQSDVLRLPFIPFVSYIETTKRIYNLLPFS